MPDLETERRAIRLFDALLSIPEDSRDAWIDNNVGTDEALRRRLRALRHAEHNAAIRTGGLDELDIVEDDPEELGAYRILRLIGRGGMGSVYLAERKTGDFDHKVAIKVIKPGLLSETLIERFQRERQTLASLSHPNIAQLFDGGETPAGSPYIVMEWIDGQPLLTWAAEAPDTDRARIFLTICDAVAFAHSHLIVHRDLTPSNLLVTPSGFVKLIDFGIARPASETAKNCATPNDASIGSMSLTPGYAAPERHVRTDVTTAADVYSLGRVLHRLFETGHRDPDLAAIVHKSTADDPLDRYVTVTDLAADVSNWREGLPVAAYRGGRRYRVRKFVLRHRGLASAATLALLLLLGAFLGTTLAYAQAQRARAAEAARSQELRSLAHYLMFDHLDRLGRTPGTVETRARLADHAQRYLAQFASSAGADGAAKLEAARGLNRLARLRGVPIGPNLGQNEEARANLITALDLLHHLPSDDPEVATQIATALADRAMIELYRDHRGELAERSLGDAAAALAVTPRSARDDAWRAAQSDVWRGKLSVLIMNADYKTMNALADTAGRTPASTQARSASDMLRQRTDGAIATHYRAFAMSQGENQKASIPLYLSAERQFVALEKLAPGDPYLLYWLAWNDYLASGMASAVGPVAEGARLLKTAETTVKRLIALEPRDLALANLQTNLMRTRAQQYDLTGRFDEAIALQRKVLAREQGRLNAERASTNLNAVAFELTVLGRIALHAEQRQLVCESWRQATDLYAITQARGELTDYYAYYPPRLRANLRRCDSAVPVADFDDFE